MTKVLEYSPPWLARFTPAHHFLTAPTLSREETETLASENDFYEGPRRTIARRGREIFAVIRNQIRWADLAVLKDQWQEGVKEKREGEEGDGEGEGEGVEGTPLKGKGNANGRGFGLGILGKQSVKGEETEKEKEKKGWKVPYRILNANIYGEITQLSISPDGVFMLIVTRHTVHVAVLPDASHLTSDDRTHLKIKTFQLGPTEHVRPHSPVISALWHPLGVFDTHGGCVVTVTQDANLRLWEFNKNDHSSFNNPTVAVDLKKLADASSTEDTDLSPAGLTASRQGFCFDLVDMEVTSACFGGNGFAEEDPWSPFTLWIALRTGALYALCPLLPSKWQVPSFSMPILTDALLTALVDLEEDYEEAEEEFYIKQHNWLREIDSQQPLPLPESCSWRIGSEIRYRPDGFSAIPKLQGPFLLDIEDPDDLDVTDIMVIPARVDLESVIDTGEELAEDVEDGPPVTMIVLATKSGIVHTCLQMEGVSAEWLPKRVGFAFSDEEGAVPAPLVPLEALETAREQDQRSFAWPVLTQDVQSRYSFYVTNSCYVTYLSFSNWAEQISKQFADPDAERLDTRLNVICDGPLATREVIARSTEAGIGGGEIASTLSPHRLPYQAPSIFYAPDPLENFLKSRAPRDKSFLTGEIVLSPATLDVIVAAHALLSRHTATLERAASGLFVRAQRLNDELRDQLLQLSEVSNRITGVNEQIGAEKTMAEAVKGEGDEEDTLTARVSRAKKRQAELQERYERVRSQLVKTGGKPLSFREKSWFNEVEMQSRSLEDTGRGKSRIVGRVEDAKSVAQSLISEAKQLAEQKKRDAQAQMKAAEKEARKTGKPAKVPFDQGRADVRAAMQIIDRESSMIENITTRLAGMTTGFDSV
ncbi:hypothetical protein AAP_05161 [Ascosphaera apis ARSEF 7405]|uniref:Nuclear pore complex protein An-Nup82 n=1 Tax=Ascosphaera apis ARSEF 7405 TaxID=392613 RepID=A0A167VWG8_9EURO|nr:hypothetical protein AAP_05161 [Ascosphaera apis ARSEF 7405]